MRVDEAAARPKCPQCRAPSRRVHDHGDNEARNLEMPDRSVSLVRELGAHGVRAALRFCGDHPAAQLARRVVQDAQAMAVNVAACRHRMDWRPVDVWAEPIGQEQRRQRCRVP